MYKIAVIGDYDSIYGFATLGLSICPVKTREDARKKLKQLADGQYGNYIYYRSRGCTDRRRDRAVP